MYTTPTEVIRFTGVKPTDFRGLNNDNDQLNSLIEEWITQAESLINSYCHRTFTEDFDYYGAISNICLRLVANMVALAQARKDTPITKYNDWNIQAWISSDIFTEDLKKDLEPFKIDKSNNSDKIDIVAITGKPLDKTLW